MVARRRRKKDSEVHAYMYIRDNLKQLGWDVRNPARHAAGQVYTQAECLSDAELKKRLVLDKPENVVKVTETVYWVIEAKPTHAQLGQATGEAQGYARKINKSKSVEARFVSGVAGSETDSFLVETQFLSGNRFTPITINDEEVSCLISPEVARTVLEGGPDIKDVPVDEQFFLKKAERINEILHLGAINKNYRARVMAALLLALIDKTPPNIDAQPRILVNDINARAKGVLRGQGKGEFCRYVELALPATEDNHMKFRTAIVQTLQELNNLHIRSAMNSGADVLGKFYEVFLKYGNGAKEIGIVLTPRHITKFAVDVLNITNTDIVYDPTCGTGGFLVAAFDQIRQNYDRGQVSRFKQHNLFGMEQDGEVVALAVVNMIFRGDGKNNIAEGNCFQKNLVGTVRGNVRTADYSPEPASPEQLAVTRVLMNPPFALKRTAEKEFRFVDQALSQMQTGGLLFSVLPYSAMVRPKAYQSWRRNSLLKKNTLLCVITFPEDLFYPIGVHTLGIFVKKGVPHPSAQPVLWVRALNDGLLKSKGKRLPDSRAKDDFAQVLQVVKAFLPNPTMEVKNIECFQKACPIDFGDPLLELVPENYLDQAPPTATEVRAGVERVVRDCVAFLVRTGKENEL